MSPNPPGPDDQGGAEFAALLGDTMTGLDSREDAISADVLRVGRPRRRRRVLASVVGTAAAVAVLGGLGAYGLGAGTPPGQLALPAAPGSSTPGPSTPVPSTPVPSRPVPSTSPPVPSPAATGAPTPAPPRPTGAAAASRQLPARVAALYLSRLAPSGVIGQFAGQEADDEVYVEAQEDLGRGKVGLQVNVQNRFMDPGSKEAESFYRCDRETFASCSVQRSNEGWVLLTATQRVVPGTPRRGTTVSADLLRADGTRIVVLTGDVSDLKYGGTPRRGITVAQARAIATDEVWNLYDPPSAADLRAAKEQIKPWRLIS